MYPKGRIQGDNELLKPLCNLLEWAKGNRGDKDINPYCVPEVKEALKAVAKIQGIKDYLDADTQQNGICNTKPSEPIFLHTPPA